MLLSGGPEQYGDLALLRALLTRVGGEAALVAGFRADVVLSGRAVLTRPEAPGIASGSGGGVAAVAQLLALQAAMAAVVAGPFAGGAVFAQALSDALETVLNDPAGGSNATTTSTTPTTTNRVPEWLARYLDDQLRSGGKDGGGAEQDALFDRVLALLRFVHGALNNMKV